MENNDDRIENLFNKMAKFEREVSDNSYANKFVEKIVIGALGTAGVTIIGLAITAIWNLIHFTS